MIEETAYHYLGQQLDIGKDNCSENYKLIGQKNGTEVPKHPKTGNISMGKYEFRAVPVLIVGGSETHDFLLGPEVFGINIKGARVFFLSLCYVCPVVSHTPPPPQFFFMVGIFQNLFHGSCVCATDIFFYFYGCPWSYPKSTFIGARA